MDMPFNMKPTPAKNTIERRWQLAYCNLTRKRVKLDSAVAKIVFPKWKKRVANTLQTLLIQIRKNITSNCYSFLYIYGYHRHNHMIGSLMAIITE